MDNRVIPVDLKDTMMYKNVKLVSISAYCMQLIYTDDISGIDRNEAKILLFNMIDVARYSDYIKKLAKNLVSNMFTTDDIGETILQSKDTVQTITAKETISQLSSLLTELGFENLKETLKSKLIKKQAGYKKELGIREETQRKRSLYKNINATKLRQEELRDIYTYAVRKEKGINIDFYSIREDKKDNTKLELGKNKNKSMDLLQALYSMSTGLPTPTNLLDETELEDACRFNKIAIDIIKYKLGLLDAIQYNYITGDIKQDVLEIEKLFNFS